MSNGNYFTDTNFIISYYYDRNFCYPLKKCGFKFFERVLCKNEIKNLQY